MTTHQITTLDEIITLLEQKIPANQQSPKNQKLRGKLEQKLAKYFRSLEDAFPYSKLAGIYNRNVKESIPKWFQLHHNIQESLNSETNNILNPLLAAFDNKLEADIGGQLTETYISGQAEMITWGKTKGGVPIAYEGPPISQAVKWAEKHTATLVKGLDDETKRRLAHTISQGIQNKRGVPGLARDIRTTFADMTKFRSELIARTETASALSQASLDTMKDMGIGGKEWVTVGDADVSDECLANEAQKVIPVDQAFTSGPMAPPQHPDCRCSLAPARLRK